MRTLLPVTAFALLLAGPADAQTPSTSSATPTPGEQSALPLDTMNKERMRTMDKDGDGLITKVEADSKMRKDWAIWDRNSDGRIDGNEFDSASNTQQLPRK